MARYICKCGHVINTKLTGTIRCKVCRKIIVEISETGVPLNKFGQPDFLAMQHNREESGIPHKQTSEEKRMTDIARGSIEPLPDLEEESFKKIKKFIKPEFIRG